VDGGRRVAQRDRFGQRPFYWTANRTGVLAGPSLLALASRTAGAEWDPDAAALALLGALPEERSLLRGVQRLPAGATLSIAESSMSPWTRSSPGYAECAPPKAQIERESSSATPPEPAEASGAASPRRSSLRSSGLRGLSTLRSSPSF